MLKRYYQILGLPPGATKDQVKKAYRNLAKRYHPDISTEPDAQERFVEITQAYEKIIDRLNRPVSYTAKRPTRKQRKAHRDHVRRQQYKYGTPHERAWRYAQMNYQQYQKEHGAFYTNHTRAIVTICIVIVGVPMSFYLLSIKDLEGVMDAVVGIIVVLLGLGFLIFRASRVKG